MLFNNKYSLKSRLFRSHWLCLLLSFAIVGFQPFGDSPDQPEVLFIAYDQGESNAFLELRKTLTQNFISYRVIAFGRASEIFNDHSSQAGISKDRQQQLKQSRNNELSASELQNIIQSINPKIVYSGMSSIIQAQLMNAFKDKGTYTIAFYDNFDPIIGKEYVQPFLSNVNPPDEYHIPSNSTRTSFYDQPTFAQSALNVSGNPALETWDSVYQKTDENTIRQELKIKKNQPIVVFAGGYDNTYEAYLRVFIDATRLMPSIRFLITYHPKTEGKLEKSIVRELAANNVQVIEKGTYSTTELSKLSEAVAVHKSSIGAQALYKNKPVLFVAEPEFTNFLIQKQLASLASSPEQVKNKLLSVIKADKHSSGLSRIGVPEKPSQTITDLLLLKLRGSR